MPALPRISIALVQAFLTILALANCQTTPNDASNPTDPASTWKVDMHHLSESLSTLLPLSLDPLAFNDPNNQPQIEREVARLTKFSHAIGQMKTKPSEDPALQFVANEFSAEMSEAQRQMRMGNRAYARLLIRNATNYCVSCHTQMARGPEFNFKAGPYFAKLGALDQANYLFAVRSFDEGLKQFDRAMSSPDVALQPYASLESTTLKALAVAVRVRQDPRLADEIVTRITQSKWAPVYLQISALKWKSSIEEWAKDLKRKRAEDPRALLAKAWKKQTETPLSRAGLIEFLRASARLHELLAEKKTGKVYAETLYQAGLTSEALRELDLYSLSEYYYESCIRSLPQSETARTCYVRLENEMMASYSSFDSGPLPASMRDRLENLKKLAESQDGGWTNWGKAR